MLAVFLTIIALVCILLIGVSLIDYYITRKKQLMKLFVMELDKLNRRSDRRRNSSEMAAIIRIVENERDKRA
jgi:purine-cytosine permease-like protein